MEKFQQLREEAVKYHRMADHMLNVTYPLLKDTKLLLGVTDNLLLACYQAMSSILHHERLFKLVPAFADNFESKVQTLHSKCARRHKIDQAYFDLLLELKEIIQLHKTSPVEFRRQDRFIICTDKYKIKAITSNQLKDYVVKAGEFMVLMDKITSRNERFFKDRV